MRSSVVLRACALALAALCVLLPSTAVAETTLVVVVNPKNDIADLKASQLTDIVMGRLAVWPNGRRVTLVLRDDDSPERAALLRLCCRLTPDAYRRHMVRAVFAGEASAEPKSVGSAALIKRFVANVPGAVGFIPLTDVDDTVRVVRVGGHAPTDAGYALVAP